MNRRPNKRGIRFAECEKILTRCATDDNETNDGEVSPLTAALIGDAWFTLYVRRRLLVLERNKVSRLHEASAKMVSAVCQAAAYHAIEHELTDDEREIFRRARNVKSHAPKSAGVGDYHISTGFEALLGTLLITEQISRLEKIAALAFAAIAKDLAEKERSAS